MWNIICRGQVPTISDVNTLWEIAGNCPFNISNEKGFFQVQLIDWSKVTSASNLA